MNSRAGLAVGDAVFSSVRYTGVMFVSDTSDNDVIGILFGYKDNKNFYTLTSSKTNSNQVCRTLLFMKCYTYAQGYWKLTKVTSVTGHPSQELAVN